MIKWNAGHTKFKFNENALLGHRVMNNALVAREDEDDNNTGAVGDMMSPLNISSAIKTNTFGLMNTNNKVNNDS